MRDLITKYSVPSFLFLYLLSFTLAGCNHSNNNSVLSDTIEEPIDSMLYISMIFAGDVMGHGRQLRASYNSETNEYDFSDNYLYISGLLKSFDLAFANLEVPLGKKGPYKGYPLFNSPPAKLIAMANGGFNVMLTANNHSNDAGKDAFINTIDFIEEQDLYQTGTFRNRLERDSLYPLIISRNGFKIAVLNYSYGTNGIPDNYPCITNTIDTAQIRKDINKAHESKPDIIISCMHWGVEYQLIENSSQRRLAQFLADAGVDLIIGSHPHVIQPIRWIQRNDGDSILCVYSLGNFISNQRFPNTDGGLLFDIKFSKNKFTNEINIEEFYHHIIWVLLTDKTTNKPHGQYYVIPVLEFENDSFPDLKPDAKYMKEMNNFVKNMRAHLSKNAVSTERMSLESD